MDRVLGWGERKRLMHLLGVPLEKYGNYPVMRDAYKSKVLEYHPDKGGDGKLMSELNNLWKAFTDGLHLLRECEEREHKQQQPEPTEQSFPEEPTCEGTQSSFTATPPKRKKTEKVDVPDDFPECLSDYLSHAVYSNKTLNCFLIFTTQEKTICLYDKIEKYIPEFKSRHAYRNDGGMLFVLTGSKHRVSAIKNFCKSFCSVSFVLCKGVIKIPELYHVLCKEPFKLLQESKPGIYKHEFAGCEERQEMVDWTKIALFAQQINSEDALLIMGHYLEFNVPPSSCEKCQEKKYKSHYEHHESHYTNARLFYQSKSQKTICQQAADSVSAKKRVKLMHSTRSDLFKERIMESLVLIKELDIFSLWFHMAGVAWYLCLMDDIDVLIMQILKSLVENIPKKRNILLRGPINTGKTTLAAAILDLCGGKALNLNCPSEKLPFELGCAIDQFMVVLEDVKGSSSLDKKLLPGQGVHNLDNLREHLDGCVKVNLEKKHVNKRSQIFPPCIVTMNEYALPATLVTRFTRIVQFNKKDCLRVCLEQNDEMQCRRVLQSGLTIVLLLIWCRPVSDFVPGLQEDIRSWKQILDSEITFEKMFQMQCNIKDGKDPLEGIVVEEGEDKREETQDSGYVA
ncbi:large T antigen [Myocastor coypus polyomavirus 1]|uniref:large T antigen n=1 Tax=Myocastor coypus polyomavirus 1 TaxID=2304056 RepID=UPI000E8CAB4E|nr:large T antigen [Myocastor coypus polyomavirus 1]AXS76445.1 large T antigen [Myocastor coypus polyomavirus 1]